MLAEWLNQPAVAAWWTDTGAQVAALHDKLDDPALHMLIVLRDGAPIAYAQCSEAAHWRAPHYDALDTPEGTIALDVFSGPGGMGCGGEWLDDLARHLLKRPPALIIDPDPANLRAIRAYEKAGFRGESVLLNEEGLPAHMMTRYR